MKDIPIIINIMRRNNPHHIVGVHALCSCSLANISDFSHVAVLLRMVLPAFRFLSNFMYNGYNTIVIMNVASVKLRIKVNFPSIFLKF